MHGGVQVTAAQLTFRDAGGVEIAYRRWLPAGQPGAVVLVAHGLSEHSGRYDRFARAVVSAAGHAVYAPDHRGHGRTAASTGVGRTGPGGTDAVVADLRELAAIAVADVAASGSPSQARASATAVGEAAAVAPLPVALFGHSMGALLAQAFAERHGDELAALVLCGSGGVNEGLGDVVAGLQAAADAGLADEPLEMLGALNAGFEPARTPFDWLSRDAAEVDAYVADPMCGTDAPPTYAFIAGIMQLAVDVMTPAAIAAIPPSLPVLLVTGTRDAASGDAAQVRELDARLRAAGLDVDARYYADARHELLNELNRDDVTADIIGWLDDHLRATVGEPGGA